VETFPGLREYLVARFGARAAAARVTPLASRPGAVKEGGYGVPQLVTFPREGGGTTVRCWLPDREGAPD